MPMEWALLTLDLDDEEGITKALQQLWEPFAAYGGELYLKQQVFNEDREPQSSTRNRLGDKW